MGPKKETKTAPASNENSKGCERDEDDASVTGSDSDESGSEEEEEEEVKESPGDCATQEEGGQPAGKKCAVYILESSVNSGQSYVGFTVNMARRIRQHNGDLKSGGARCTTKYRPWHIAAILSADPSWFDKRAALQLEYALQRCGRWKSKPDRPWHEPGPALARGRAARARAVAAPLFFAGRKSVTRRLNDLLWLLSHRAAWTFNAPVYSDPERHRLTLRLAPSFLTEATKTAFESCGHWRPIVLPMPSALVAVTASATAPPHVAIQRIASNRSRSSRRYRRPRRKRRAVKRGIAGRPNKRRRLSGGSASS
jgi:predicted GIY-YIG superfamily endonuclease